MADEATTLARIEAIDEQLAKGVRSRTLGDMSADYDLAALRRERSALMQSLYAPTGKFRAVVFKRDA